LIFVRFKSGLPDFSCYKMPKWGKIYQITANLTKCPWYVTQDRNIGQVSIKYTVLFHCKTLQNLPKFGFLVWKQTIWQPWPRNVGFNWHPLKATRMS
jgi:hypothetical protein